MSTQPKVCTVSETAKMLRISRATAYEGVRSGSIPSIRVGRRVLIPLVALEALLRGEKVA